MYKGSKPVTIRIPTNIIDSKKQKLAIMPNIIHSLDASMVISIINNYNSYNFFSIHDCFATTANNIGFLNYIIRIAFIELYANEPYINKLHNFIINYIKQNNYIIEEEGKHTSYILLEGEKYYIPIVPKISDMTLFLKEVKKAIYMVN